MLAARSSSCRGHRGVPPNKRGPRGGRVVVRSFDSAVVWEYLDLYGRMICTGPVDERAACLSSAVVPPADVQRTMLALFEQVMTDLGGQTLGLESVFWKLIVVRDVYTLGELANAVVAFNVIKDVIAQIVANVREMPIHTSVLGIGGDLPVM